MKQLSEKTMEKLRKIRKEYEGSTKPINLKSVTKNVLSDEEYQELFTCFGEHAVPDGNVYLMPKADYPFSDSIKNKFIKAGGVALKNGKDCCPAQILKEVLTEEEYKQIMGLLAKEQIPEKIPDASSPVWWTHNRECSDCNHQTMALWRCYGEYGLFQVWCDHYDEEWVSSGIYNTYRISCSKKHYEPYLTSRVNPDVPW